MHTAENPSYADSPTSDRDHNLSAACTDSFISIGNEDYNPAETTSTSSSEGDGDPRMITFLHDEPKPRGWVDRPLTVLKYVDDFMGIEKLFTANGIRSISEHKMEVSVRAIKSEAFFSDVEKNAQDVGMSVNAKKTQMLCISAQLHSRINSYIKINNEIVTDQQTLKILGFMFGTKPDVSAHVEVMCKKFRRRVWVLRHLKKANIPVPDLIRLYLSLVLPTLDYSCVVYHSLLSITQSQQLEGLQKLALKIIYGVTGVSYSSLLENSGLSTLSERRLGLVDGFLRKAIKDPRYDEWFPTREFTHHDLRKENIYVEKFARTSRLYNSPLYFYRRRLNNM